MTGTRLLVTAATRFGGELRIELLGRKVTIVAAGGHRVDVEDELDRWLLITLVWESRERPTAVAKAVLAEGTGLSTTSGALRQRIRRLREASGLPIQTEPKIGYRLDLEQLSVDAFEFIDCAEAGLAAPIDSRGERPRLLGRARDLWQGGLPAFFRLRQPAPELHHHLGRLERGLKGVGRRILIIDDQLADILAEQLIPDHECEVAHSFEEYARLGSDELKSFDLLVVDRHLSASYGDRRGEDIVQDLNRRALGIPVFMITSRPPSGEDLSDWETSLGLARAAWKDGDGPTADIHRIVRQISGLLAESPVEESCRHIEKSIVDLRRVAYKRLQQRADSPRMLESANRQMEAEAEALREAARANDLRRAQQAFYKFQVHWTGNVM